MKVSKVIRKNNVWIKSNKSIQVNDEDITEVYFNGFVPCYKLTFSDGDTLVCSHNHKLKSKNGDWVEADSINIGFIFNNGLTLVDKEDAGIQPTMDIKVPASHKYKLPNNIDSHNSSSICGTVSPSIEPIVANTFNQKLAGGTVTRINPTLMKIMQERGVLTQELIDEIGRDYNGSVQHVDWLTSIEKQVFKTAYEIDQQVLIDLAADRQKYICQGQSLNLFFVADASEEEVARVHLSAMFNPNIKSIYYMRSQSSSKGSSGESEVKVACESCEA